MGDSEEFETWCTDEPVCPHCGTVAGDAWEWAATETDTTCDDCGKDFHVTPDYSVTYTTRPTEPKP